ncbi:MAG: HEAT repeat domain-containing protein [Eubacteriaceae bacterium]
MGIFKPAWQGKNEAKAAKAVSKISDRAKLEEIANNAPLDVVRYIAIKKISSMPNTFGVAERLFSSAINTQSFLQDVALNDGDRMFRQYAVEKLTDQTLIAHIAKKDNNECVRNIAVKKLTDQSVLSDVSQNDPEWYVRKEAVIKLTNKELLSHIAKNDSHGLVRSEAVNKISDQSVLADVSLNDQHWEARLSAIMKVTNQSVIGHYLVNESKREGSYKWFNQHCNPIGLLSKINTPAIIAYIAENIEDDTVGEKAVKMITDEVTLIGIAKSSEANISTRLEAIKLIEDERVLTELALKISENPQIRQAIIYKMNDLALLSEIVKNDKDEQIRISALHRMNKLCLHKWTYDDHCRRKCDICGVYEYDHDYVQTNVIEYGGASHSIDYECKKCGHKANYSQGELTAHDGRETGFILE